MSFAQPWFLLGTLAALIPLAIHLFDRRRPRPQPLPTIAFVLRSQRRQASRLKLRRILLYTLRTLILLAVPVALARPQRPSAAAAAELKRGLAATVIVIDGSLSMRFREPGGESLFGLAQDEARAAIRALAPEEPATVQLCGGSVPAAPLSFDRAQLLNGIDEIRPSFESSDLSQCLERATHLLEGSSLPAKRLVVISDFAAHALQMEAPPPTVTAPSGSQIRPEVILRPVGSAEPPLKNHALTDLKVQPVAQAGPRTFQFLLTARNFSSEPVSALEASIKLGDRVVAKGFLDLPARGSATKVLQHRFDVQGPVSGEVALTADGLEEDDRRSFVVSVPRELKALVINGAPQTVRYEDEAFFTEAALSAPGSPVQAIVRDADSGLRERFTDYDVVLLLNLPAPDEAVVARLRSFVEAGGGLFISVGDRVDPELYNRRLGGNTGLLPRPLRLIRTAAARDEPDGARKAARLGEVHWNHSIFSLFEGPAREGLLGSRFYRYMLLEPKGAAEVLATYEDGSPALTEVRRGQGRVLFFTSTVDRDWSDFAIRTSFLPLMQRFSAYLCGALEEKEELQGRVGEALLLRVDRGVPLARLRPPGDEKPIEVQLQPDGHARIGPLAVPGIYRAESSDGTSLPALDFAASLPARESDLSRIPSETLEQYFGEDRVSIASGASSRERTPFWTWLILLATLAFLGEGALLRQP